MESEKERKKRKLWMITNELGQDDIEILLAHALILRRENEGRFADFGGGYF